MKIRSQEILKTKKEKYKDLNKKLKNQTVVRSENVFGRPKNQKSKKSSLKKKMLIRSQKNINLTKKKEYKEIK